MRVFAFIQALMAAALVLSGLVALLGVGITGLFLLLPGAAFAVVAGLAQSGGRAGLLLALMADAGVAAAALKRLLSLPQPVPFPAAGVLDVGLPVLALALLMVAVGALMKDWRSVRAIPWFGRGGRVAEGVTQTKRA